MAGSDESLADRGVSARMVVITLPSFVSSTRAHARQPPKGSRIKGTVRAPARGAEGKLAQVSVLYDELLTPTPARISYPITTRGREALFSEQLQCGRVSHPEFREQYARAREDGS